MTLMSSYGPKITLGCGNVCGFPFKGHSFVEHEWKLIIISAVVVFAYSCTVEKLHVWMVLCMKFYGILHCTVFLLSCVCLYKTPSGTGDGKLSVLWYEPSVHAMYCTVNIKSNM